MPFGTHNAPTEYQCVMDMCIVDAGLTHCCNAYIDNLLVQSFTAEQHLQDVAAVLRMLQANRFKAHPDKSMFGADVVEIWATMLATMAFHPLKPKSQPSVLILAPPTCMSCARPWAFLTVTVALCPTSLPLQHLSSVSPARVCPGNGRSSNNRPCPPLRQPCAPPVWCCIVLTPHVPSCCTLTGPPRVMGQCWGKLTQRGRSRWWRASSAATTSMNGGTAHTWERCSDSNFTIEHRPGIKHQNADVLSRWPLPSDDDSTDALLDPDQPSTPTTTAALASFPPTVAPLNSVLLHRTATVMHGRAASSLTCLKPDVTCQGLVSGPQDAFGVAHHVRLNTNLVANTFFPAIARKGVVLLELFGGMCAACCTPPLGNPVNPIPSSASPCAYSAAFTSLPSDVRSVATKHLVHCGATAGRQWLVVAGRECKDLSPAGSQAGMHSPHHPLTSPACALLARSSCCNAASPLPTSLNNVVVQHNFIRSAMRDHLQPLCHLFGEPMCFDAAIVGSFAHRVRNHWTNLCDTIVAACVLVHANRGPIWVQDILDPGRTTPQASILPPPPAFQCEIVGQPQRARPTLVATLGSYAFKTNGSGLMLNYDGTTCEPTMGEREASPACLATTLTAAVEETSGIHTDTATLRLVRSGAHPPALSATEPRRGLRPAVVERIACPVSFDDLPLTATSLLQRSSVLNRETDVAMGNIRIVQHRDTLHYALTHSGSYKPAARHWERLGGNGVARVMGKCGWVMAENVCNLATCHLPDIDPTIDHTLAHPAADFSSGVRQKMWSQPSQSRNHRTTTCGQRLRESCRLSKRNRQQGGSECGQW
ncbi:integrase catalytic domain-containing protein [Haematococcus lacustris]|uniref:Integrase catalytic domain-containing protein n=1 Tax=Haematococcus lacustris TaxID=44745 RepID=A0A6A0ADF2_HAELA|nr:integrase catalytic domain-containing protein [Haematococcus lacustris]